MQLIRMLVKVSAINTYTPPTHREVSCWCMYIYSAQHQLIFVYELLRSSRAPEWDRLHDVAGGTLEWGSSAVGVGCICREA